MKKMMLSLGLFFMTASAVFAGDVPIQKSDLPAAAQRFLSEHFPKADYSYITKDKDMVTVDYKVVFKNGDKVEFDQKGNWDDVECKAGVPVAVIPAKISDYLRNNNVKGDRKVVKIDKDKMGYEVKLSDGKELKFNSKQVFKGYDN